MEGKEKRRKDGGREGGKEGRKERKERRGGEGGRKKRRGERGNGKDRDSVYSGMWCCWIMEKGKRRADGTMGKKVKR